MRSKLAEGLKVERRAREESLGPEARLALARRLGDEALAALARSGGFTLREAARELARRRQLGRRPSGAARA